MRMLISVAAIATCLMPSMVGAQRVYRLVDYPALQQGATVTGTITTTNDAPADGQLTVDEVLDWEWTSERDSPRFARLFAEFDPPSPSFSSTTLNDVAITKDFISLPAIPGAQFGLAITRDPLSRGRSDYGLSWSVDPGPDAEQWGYYGAGGIIGGDILVRFWSSYLTSSTASPVVLAIAVPQASTLTMGISIAFLALLRRRPRRQVTPVGQPA